MDNLGFQPNTQATQPAQTGSSGTLGFQPDGGTAPVTPKDGGGSGLGSFALNAGGAALNFINNNPISHGITSLAAMPVQLLAKALGQPDPYAGGIGTGPGTVHVTSSDQPMGKYLEEQAGNAATVGSLFIPAGEVAAAGETGLKSVLPTAAARFAGPAARIATGAGVGAIQGAAGAMQTGGNAAQVGQGAKTGGIVGGSLSTAGEILGAILDSVGGTTGETRLESHVKSGGAAKTLTRAFNDASTANTDPISTMQQNGLIKDLRVIDGKVNVDGLTNPAGTGSLDNLIQDQQDLGSQAVKSMKGGVSVDAFRKTAVDAVQSNPSIKASGNVQKVVAEINRRMDDYAASYGDQIDYQDIDRIRKAMNKVWDPDTWDAEKAIGNTARASLYQGAGAPGALTNAHIGAGKALQSAMQSEQELINAKEFVQKLGGTAVKGGRLGKYIADATGAVLGGAVASPIPFVGPALGGAVGAYATNKAVNALQAGYFNPAMAGYARSLSGFAPVAGAATKIGQAALIPSITQGQQ